MTQKADDFLAMPIEELLKLKVDVAGHSTSSFDLGNMPEGENPFRTQVSQLPFSSYLLLTITMYLLV